MILDALMPSMNGFEVLAAMMDEDDLKETPIVMLSARSRGSNTETPMLLAPQPARSSIPFARINC